MRNFRMQPLLFILFSMIFSISNLWGQQSFELSHVNKKDTTFFYIHNNTNDTINGVSINATWFHMGEGLVFWPADMLTGISVYKTEGIYPAANMKFKFKSYQRMSFDFDVANGDSQLFAFAVNYVASYDTLMCANVQIWYLDNNDSLNNYKVLPKQSSANNCEYEQYYLVSNLGSSDGIKWGSAANFTLHKSNICTSGLAIVIIDRNSLKPTHVNGITPNCVDGRKWTTFGYPTDEQVFYYFDMTDTNSISQIIQLIEAVPTGDHVFISTLGTTATDFRSTRMRNALKLIGASGNETQNELYSLKTLCGFGSKGAASGTYYGQAVQPLQSSVYTLREYIFFPGKNYDSTNAFSSCYEKGISVIMPEQPKQNAVIALNEIEPWIIYPNPVTQFDQSHFYVLGNWNATISENLNIKLLNTQGQTVPFNWKKLDGNKLEIVANDLNKGVYILKIQNQSQKILVN